MTKNLIINGFKLDKNQLKVISTNTNMLIIAGAGSGKTFTIIAKVQHLINNNLCKPNEILIISFTNATVNDLKQKIKQNVDVHTFHKLSIFILKKAKVVYNISQSNTLHYIINEYLLTCSKEEQKTILKYLKISMPYKLFIKSKHYYSFIILIESYINTFKTNNLVGQHIMSFNYSIIEKKILIIMFQIYKKYLQEKRSVNELDFDDLIILATHTVKSIDLQYKYIIIDEFQDTSYIRLNLIKEIYESTNSTIIAVGDDWQSIYHFSGCNLQIFMNFEKYFQNVKRIYLSNTYRNSYELIKIASKFIEKNEYQIKKELSSQNHNQKPIVFCPYKNRKKTLKNILNFLLKTTSNIMILARNNTDIYDYIDSSYVLNNNQLLYSSISLNYYTIHKSKGLEADYVILLNCNNNILGLPNKIETNKLLEKLNPNNEMEYAEERRIFYVAITRCRKQLYILYDKYNPSIFIKEIKKIVKKELKKITYFK
jgi:DNA helicase-4